MDEPEDKQAEDEDEENLAQESSPSITDDLEIRRYITRELEQYSKEVIEVSTGEPNF